MRAVIQRTKQSSVAVEGNIIASIGQGLTVLLGISPEDTEEDAKYLAEKIINLRIFSDEAGKMNLSVKDIKGELLVISQFTLYGDCRKGRRPSFDGAARPDFANILYTKFLSFCRDQGIHTQNGKFQAEMLVQLENDGPVTLLVESKRLF